MNKCIKIDVINEVVSEVEIEDNIQHIYKQLECDTFEVVEIDGVNDIYVDEEGLLKVNENTKFFVYGDYPQPISGHGLIMGHDDKGNSISTTLTVEEVNEKVKFLTLFEVQTKVREGMYK